MATKWVGGQVKSFGPQFAHLVAPHSSDRLQVICLNRDIETISPVADPKVRSPYCCCREVCVGHPFIVTRFPLKGVIHPCLRENGKWKQLEKSNFTKKRRQNKF